HQPAVITGLDLGKNHDARDTSRYVSLGICLINTNPTSFPPGWVRSLIAQQKIRILGGSNSVDIDTSPASERFHPQRSIPQKHGIVGKILIALPDQSYRQRRFAAAGGADQQESRSISSRKAGAMKAKNPQRSK